MTNFVALFLQDVSSNALILTQVALSRSDRMLFAGTSDDTIQLLFNSFPLRNPGEWQDYKTHSRSITKIFEIANYKK